MNRILPLMTINRSAARLASLLQNFIFVTHFCSYKKNKVDGEFPLINPIIFHSRFSSLQKEDKHGWKMTLVRRRCMDDVWIEETFLD